MGTHDHHTLCADEIWFEFERLLPPSLRVEPRYTVRSSFWPSIAADKDLSSYKVKDDAHIWWLSHSSQPWENIFPYNTWRADDLSYKIFSSWHGDLTRDRQGSGEAGGRWPELSGPLLEPDTGDALVQVLVEDIYKRFKNTKNSGGVRIRAGDPSTKAPGTSSSNAPAASLHFGKPATRRRQRNDGEAGDRSNGDEPNRGDKAKRQKKKADEYSRYVICTEFAASRDPASPNCFFGAWPSVDRLKQDHLVKVHKFDSTMMKVGKGGTESEKWWRLFDQLHPGFRESHPDTFIPGPLWEDRIARNAYNKILSRAMQEAEAIRRRNHQVLASQIHDLLNQQQDTERQEMRQMISSLISSSTRTVSTLSPLTPEPDTERQPQGMLSQTHHDVGIIAQQDNSSSILTSEINQVSSNTTSNTYIALSPSRESSSNSHLTTLAESSSYSRAEGDFAADMYQVPTNSTSALLTSSQLPFQTNFPTFTAPSAASSETLNWQSYITEPSLSDLQQEPFGKVCRCRSHSSECTNSSTVERNEWCVGCSGWFPWSAMAEPFFLH
jgi:hypothetical protein